MRTIIVILAAVALALTGACSVEDEPTQSYTSTPVGDGSTEAANEEILSSRPGETEQPEQPEPTTEPEPKTENPDSATVGEQNALLSALDYLDFAGFSESGLAGQLEYEGYTAAEIEFALHALSLIPVDWNAEAVESAQSYLEFTSFSRSGLIDQLLFEGYTQAQAEHAATTVGL